jgi:hypothetical protein
MTVKSGTRRKAEAGTGYPFPRRDTKLLTSPGKRIYIYKLTTLSSVKDEVFRKGINGATQLRYFISIASFIMAVFGALAVLFIKNRDKQTMASVVAIVFLLSFLINVRSADQVFLQITCITTFALALLGGAVTIFSNEEYRRTGAIFTAIVSLCVSLMILFAYLEFRLF